MNITLSIASVTAALLSLAAPAARAADCTLNIEANDEMQFNQRQLQVDAGCETVTVTLKHAGTLTRNVMGHDWVLARTADVGALVNAGMSAGLAHNYQTGNDPRILASTPVVGGGESSTISFSTAKLQPGGDYSFFCTYPGHSVMMKGAFVFGDRSGRRVATAALAKPATAAP